MPHTKKHYTNAYTKKSHHGLDYESEKESKLYKKSLQGGDATVAERIAAKDRIEVAKDRIEAKKERDRLQAQHITPGGGGKYKYGPHKVDDNRKVIEALIGKGKVQEKIIKFANKADKKLEIHYKKKRATKEMKKRAKKLSAYESYT